MGKTLHSFSFTDFGALERGQIIPRGQIDFESTWAMNQVNWIMWDVAGKPVVHYALNAGQTEKYDIKHKAFQKYGSVYYGSALYGEGGDIIYASARDAGNFAAGMVQQRSILPNYMTSVGFGAFNYAGSKGKGFLYALEKFFLDTNPDPFGFGPSSPLRPPYYGEDKGTALAIEKGRAHYKARPYRFNLSK